MRMGLLMNLIDLGYTTIHQLLPFLIGKNGETTLFKVTQQLLETEYHGYITRVRNDRTLLQSFRQSGSWTEKFLKVLMKISVIHHRIRIDMQLLACIALDILGQSQAVQLGGQQCRLQHDWM